MNHRTLFLLLVFVFILLSNCQSKSPTGKATISNANTKRQLPEPEKAGIEKITGTDAPNAIELIAKYSSRDLGSPGWRRVRMELLTEGALTRTFTVLNIWRSDKDHVEMLFLLEEPKGLSGTDYLLRELSKDSPEMQVHLFLPAGEQRVLEVDPSNFDQGLLGSDFTYNDVRMRLPMQGYDYRVVGTSTLQNEPVWALEAEPSSELTRRSCQWKSARYYLGRNFQFLLGADYFGGSESTQNSPALLKQMRVQSFEQRNGVWTAKTMFMFSSDNRSTALTLADARFGVVNIDPSLFAVDQLPSLADKAKEGWSPEEQKGNGPS